MITCPHCHSHEIEGTLFCSQCGTKLYPLGITSCTETSDVALETDASRASCTLTQPLEVTLQCLSSGRIIALREGDSLVGRCDESKAIQPSVDLSPLGGYEGGVSRAHAMIHVGTEVSLTDLGSVNGTRINGVQVVPHKAYLLTNGDLVTFGKVKMSVHIRKRG